MEAKRIQIQDATLIGDWQEVQDVQASTITKNDADTDMLDGMLVRGYETKFGATNENGERYAKGAIDDFIERYFVGNGLNLPVDIQHIQDLEHLAGRVIYAESNSTGFYFVAYIPRTYKNYAVVRDLLKNGILQGFSKCGYATDYEWRTDENGNEYMQINKIDIVSVSLVATPANGVAFEKMQETRNALRFKAENKETGEAGNGIDYMFN